MPEYLFSQFKVSEFEALHRELSKVFEISKSKLQSLYEIMQRGFEIEEFPPENKLPRNIFRSDDPIFQKLYDEAFIIGVDIPSILEKNNGVSEKETVVILGQAPLRKSSNRIEEIGIATPYAMHLKSCREKLRNTRLYFDLIKVLLDNGYRVYLTDIFKIWVSEPSKDKGIPLSKQDYSRFIQVLKAELEIFEPLVIITWGKVASKTIKNLSLDVKHLEFPHPSGAANGKWRELIGKPATRENRINFWKQQISGYLSSL